MLLSKRTLILGGATLCAAAASAVVLSRPARAIEVGARAPAFSLQDAEGASVSLRDFAGRIVVLEWTNPSCPFVRKHYNSGNMQTLQRESTAQGVVWLRVITGAPNLDGQRVMERMRTEGAAPTATLLDPQGVMGRAYGASNTPHMFIINDAGLLVYQGAIDDHPSTRPETLQGAQNYVRAGLADLQAGRRIEIAQTTPYGCTVHY